MVLGASTKNVGLQITSGQAEVSDHVQVYAMAHLSKATIPKDAGGPFAKRIGVSVGGSLNWSLRVGAFVTRRSNPSEWSRYSLVVLNCRSP